MWERKSHAEIEALRQAGTGGARGDNLRDARTVLAHWPHRPVRECADRSRRIARVVAAMQDPNPLVSADAGLKGCAMLV